MSEVKMMPDGEKKGITVKIDAALHAEVRQYIDSRNMTMADFVAQALYNELHPKIQQEVGNMRTIAFQVPDEMYQRIKEYLSRHSMTQKEFCLGLIGAELERDQQIIEVQHESEIEEVLEENEEEMDMEMTM
ncbi:MAG: hypothetical protein J6K77_06145 [Ruminococcus sp.]|nr:hypothetical protein [Ruminococcus sp.]